MTKTAVNLYIYEAGTSQMFDICTCKMTELIIKIAGNSFSFKWLEA